LYYSAAFSLKYATVSVFVFVIITTRFLGAAVSVAQMTATRFLGATISVAEMTATRFLGAVVSVSKIIATGFLGATVSVAQISAARLFGAAVSISVLIDARLGARAAVSISVLIAARLGTTLSVSIIITRRCLGAAISVSETIISSQFWFAVGVYISFENRSHGHFLGGSEGRSLLRPSDSASIWTRLPFKAGRWWRIITTAIAFECSAVAE
jgi:hypothetical protein